MKNFIKKFFDIINIIKKMKKKYESYDNIKIQNSKILIS